MPHYTLYEPLWYCSLIRNRSSSSKPQTLVTDSHASTFQKSELYTEQFNLFPRSQREFLKNRARYQMGLIASFCGEVMYHWDQNSRNWSVNYRKENKSHSSNKRKSTPSSRGSRSSSSRFDSTFEDYVHGRGKKSYSGNNQQVRSRSGFRALISRLFCCSSSSSTSGGRGTRRKRLTLVLSELNDECRANIHQFMKKMVRLKGMDPILMLVALFFVAVFIRVYNDSQLQSKQSNGSSSSDVTPNSSSGETCNTSSLTKRFPSVHNFKVPLGGISSKSSEESIKISSRSATSQPQQKTSNLLDTIRKTDSGKPRISVQRMPSWCTLQVLFLASFLLAVKMYDPDMPKDNHSFFQIFRLSKIISLQQFNDAELFMLKVLDYDLKISIDEFMDLLKGYAPITQDYINSHVQEPQTALSSSSVSELEQDEFDF